MQQIITNWAALDARRRITVIAATLAMFAAVLMLTRMASSPSLTLLYSGLESSAAGDVVSALEQRGVAYDVRGGSIFVESSRRDELRMTLASEGLPANSARGYELLDELSGFGTTSQMFDAAYWRAKEGELARTILSHPSITGVRVHIASTGSNPFQRDVKPTASVSISTSGGSISGKQARALKFLVAAAVTGLVPEDVAIIDTVGGLIGSADEAPANAPDDRAEAMRMRIKRLLEARVGAGNVMVEASVATEMRSESIREKQIDPDSRVAISTDTEERSDTASDQGGGGGVTVASNLPQGDGAAGDSSSSKTSETRERINYEVSSTERQITLAPGAIKRLTVAVLVNGTVATDAAGVETFEPRSEEELGALRELVASVVGFDETRGDVITLKTMQFTPEEPLGTAAEPSFLAGLSLDVMSIIQALVLAVVAIVLGMFVVRPVLSGSANSAMAQLAPPADGSTASTDTAEAGLTPLTGEITDNSFDTGNIPVISDAQTGADGLSAIAGAGGQDPVERLRSLIGERQEETVEILRSWLESEEETA
ncbi:Flagellar M-ring protein FliF [hydrothermal vent metagenome]|uniref:Flagellar M-ring protein FliF n=1 Tax=hydrothermal vent metagenome TaxID=652676 RepID=A0A3B0RUJ1_9ZZZZ